MTALGDRQPTSVEENADELRRLARGVQLAKDFALYFALCNERQFTLTLISQVEEALPPNFALRVSITQPIDDLRALLLERVEEAENPPRALFLYGLESWIARDKVIENDMILRINAIRNYFTRSVPYCVVFWIPEYLYLAMIQAAPDFCSIRSGVYRFAPPENETAAPRATESLLSGDYTALMGTPLAERQERIRDLTELLTEYRSVSEGARDWLAEARLLMRLGDLHYGNGHYREAEPL
ncbi:MAG: hypothetical protein NT023_22150, partial [Armatimonadetes bacterium]|nr:hypothetical protein [Armatimonadota bacterium]